MTKMDNPNIYILDQGKKHVEVTDKSPPNSIEPMEVDGYPNNDEPLVQIQIFVGEDQQKMDKPKIHPIPQGDIYIEIIDQLPVDTSEPMEVDGASSQPTNEPPLVKMKIEIDANWRVTVHDESRVNTKVVTNINP